MKSISYINGEFGPEVPFGRAPFHGETILIKLAEGWVQAEWVEAEVDGGYHFSCLGGQFDVEVTEVLGWEDPAHLESESLESVTKEMHLLESLIADFNHRYEYGNKPAPRGEANRLDGWTRRWDTLKAMRDSLKAA